MLSLHPPQGKSPTHHPWLSRCHPRQLGLSKPTGSAGARPLVTFPPSLARGLAFPVFRIRFVCRKRGLSHMRMGARYRVGVRTFVRRFVAGFLALLGMKSRFSTQKGAGRGDSRFGTELKSCKQETTGDGLPRRTLRISPVQGKPFRVRPSRRTLPQKLSGQARSEGTVQVEVLPR